MQSLRECYYKETNLTRPLTCSLSLRALNVMGTATGMPPGSFSVVIGDAGPVFHSVHSPSDTFLISDDGNSLLYLIDSPC
eukprot:2394760-Rhodomonas_salina.1